MCPTASVQIVDVVAYEHCVAVGRVFKQQADDAHVGSRGDIGELREPVAELAVVGNVDGDGLWNQQTGESVYLHLERVGARIHAAWDDSSIEAPVTQHDALHGNRTCIGSTAGRAADGDVLAGKQSALIEEELGERSVHPVDRILL